MRSFQNFAISASAASIAAIDEHRADQRLAGVRQDGGAQAPAGVRFRIAELERGPEIHRARNLRAGFLAHQIGQPARQFALVRLRKGAIEHVGNDQAEHMVAEKFQALVAVGAGGAARQRGNMRDRAFQQRLIGEFIADPVLERGPVLLVLGLAAHRTIVNSLPQRTENGQRQNSQARSPS